MTEVQYGRGTIEIPNVVNGGVLPVVTSTVAVLNQVRSYQTALFKEHAKTLLIAKDKFADDKPDAWTLYGLPMTTERVLELVTEAADYMDRVVPTPPPTGFFVRGMPSTAQTLLTNLVTPGEMVEMATRLVLVLSEFLSTKQPSMNQTNTFHALYRMSASKHRLENDGLYVAITVSEKKLAQGRSGIDHNVTLFRYNDADVDLSLVGTIFTDKKPPESYDSVNGYTTQLMNDTQNYTYLCRVRHGAELNPNEREGPNRVSALVSYMMTPLMNDLDRFLAQDPSVGRK